MEPATPEAPKPVPKVMAELAEPFPPEAVKYRVDGKPAGDGKARVVPYVDARTVASRLNLVLGGDGWKTRITVLPNGAVLCRLAVRFPGRTDWVSREDVGSESEQREPQERTKAAVSDALKRSAVLFGVGAYLYKLPGIRLAVDDRGRITETAKLPTWALPPTHKPAGPEAAGQLYALAKTYTDTANHNHGIYMADLIRRHGGYSPDTPLAILQMRHLKECLQKVNDDIATYAAKTAQADQFKPTTGEPEQPAQTSDKLEAPKTGAGLVKWLVQIDRLSVQSNIARKDELTQYVIGCGINARIGSEPKDWTGERVGMAVTWAREFWQMASDRKNLDTPISPRNLSQAG